MAVYPVIMCGGAGTRLWPASRPSRPKQFIKLLGDASPFQDTVRRVSALGDARPPVIVGAVAHQFWIEQQLAELGLDGVLILEPTPRDSAPAMAAALAWIADTDPEAVAVVVASDHHIPDAAAFRSAIDAAVEAARDGWIVTLGVKPSGPATSYGYIKAGAPAGAAWRVDAFVEKPDAEAARSYVEAGHLWNSGNFIVQVRTFMEEMERQAPEVRSAVRRAVDEGRREGPALHLGASFAQAPRISIDYALMEKTNRAAVLPVEFAWSDVGAWDAVHDASPKDAEGNAARGEVLLEGSRDCLVHAGQGLVIAAVGVSGLAIVAEQDAVLVCDLAATQRVRQVVDRLKAGGHSAVDVSAPKYPPLSELAAGYLRWLRCAALPLWWSLGADHECGGFHEVLDREGRPLPIPRRASVQARLTGAFATAAAQSWPGPWRQAAQHGLKWLRDQGAKQGVHLGDEALFESALGTGGAHLHRAADRLVEAALPLPDERRPPRLVRLKATLLAEPAATWSQGTVQVLNDLLQVLDPLGLWGEFGEDGSSHAEHLHDLVQAGVALERRCGSPTRPPQ